MSHNVGGTYCVAISKFSSRINDTDGAKCCFVESRTMVDGQGEPILMGRSDCTLQERDKHYIRKAISRDGLRYGSLMPKLVVIMKLKNI